MFLFLDKFVKGRHVFLPKPAVITVMTDNEQNLIARAEFDTQGVPEEYGLYMAEDCIDSLKVSSDDVDVILVGGGSIVMPKNLAGTSEVYNPEHFGCANAIGSAISKVSGDYEKHIDYDKIPRDEALARAKAEAVELAVAAGAIRETVEIIEVEDVPLAYYVGNTSRVRVKAAGDLA